MKNKIIKMLEEKREYNCKDSVDYEEKSQVAYNSTIYSKMDSILWFGGISQIVLSIIVAMLINNPSFIFLKSFLTPITTPLILIPFSITIGEIIRKYLTRNDDKIKKEIGIVKKTPDYMRVASEIHYKVKSIIKKKNIEIKDKVIDNIKTKDSSCNLTYSKLIHDNLIHDNEKLKIKLDTKYQKLNELIKVQVLCQEYNMYENKKQRRSSKIKKSLLVSLVISTLLLFCTVTIGLAYISTIINLESIIRNIIINYIGATAILIPLSYLVFERQNRNILSAINDMIVRNGGLEADFIDMVERRDLYKKIINEHYGKSKRTIKKYFNQAIEDIINEIVLLETEKEKNNILINQQESLLKLSKKNNHIKSKVVSEDKKLIKFKGKIRQLVPSK